MGTMSSLAQGAYIAHSNNYQKGRNGYKVCKITPHIMAGKLTGKQCAVNIFQNPNRIASANYCIGYDGDIVCNVYEENRAYTSSSKSNDCQAITIEISNTSNTDKNYPISEKSWNSLVNLCVDICKRYNFRLNYDGTKNGSLTRHDMFANTSCPGPYLKGRLSELETTVNKILDGEKPSSKGSDEKVRTYQNGSTREVVYSDTKCTIKLGSLDPRESCDCLGVFKDRAMVRYQVGSTGNYKIGFVKYIPKSLQ